MKSKLLTLIAVILISSLSAEQYAESHQPQISYEQLMGIFSKYNNNPKGWSPLNYAIEQQDFEAALILIEYTADINKKDNTLNALQRLFANISIRRVNKLSDLQVEIVRKLVKYGIDVHSVPILRDACRFNLEEVVIELLNIGVNVNQYNGSALNGAINSGNPNLIRLLIERGIDVNLQDSLSTTIFLKNHEMISMLIDAGAHLNSENHGTHLVQGIERQDIEIINLLLTHGANPNATDHQGMYKSKSVLRVAIERYNTPQQTGENPEYYSAKRQRISDIIQLLIQYGAKL